MPGEIRYIYPPMDVSCMDRVEINTCPARMITPDVLDIVRAYNIADGVMSLSEQWQLPHPYIAAWETIRGNIATMKAHAARK